MVSDQEEVRRAHALRQAEGYLELNLPERAIAALDRLGDGDAMGARGLYLLGEAYRAMERYGEAIIPLAKVAALLPEDPHVSLAMAWCYKRVGRLELAIGAMERALKLSSGCAILHYNLACYLSLAQQVHRSLFHLSRAMTLDPAFRVLVDEETDFDPIRTDPGFVALMSLVV
ncbi:MAG: TPR end-of-group domain-containing protein [Thermoguttaceae bacterium]